MKRTFKAGDRVRLLSLEDASLHNTVVLHDVWGDESYPRNASFMGSGNEQTTHTDLMKHEDDPSPIVVPDGGTWFIAVGDNYGWGRAQTIEKAIANMRRNGGKVAAYAVHRVSKWTRVADSGALSYPRGIDPVEVKRVEPKRR